MCPVVVAKDRESSALSAHVVPVKGGDVPWIVEQLCRDIRRWGIRGDLTIRCDLEHALVDLANQVAKKRRDAPGIRTAIEHNPVGESQKKWPH